MNARDGSGVSYQCERDTSNGLHVLEPHQIPFSSLSKSHSTRYVWYVIFLLWVVNVFNYVDRIALSVLLPFIKADLKLSDTQLGLLIGFAFALFYAVCGIPIARWADRGSRRNVIALALVIWSVMTALSGVAQNFWQLFAARVGVGVGEAGCLAPSHSLICDYVRPSRRAGTYAINSFGIVVGMMLSLALAGWLGEVIGWRWTFVSFGLPGIALGLVVRLTLREPMRGFFDVPRNGEASLSFSQTVALLWRCKTYRLLLCFAASSGFATFGLSQWWPSLYTRVFEITPSSVGAYLGIAVGAGCGIGLLVGGVLANKTAQRNIRLPLVIGAAAASLAVPTVLGSLFFPSFFGCILFVSLSWLFLSLNSGPMYAALYGVVPPQVRATAGAILFFSTAVMGMGLGPFCVGLLSDFLLPSFGSETLRYAMLAPVLSLPVMVLSLYAASKHLPGDLGETGVQVENNSFNSFVTVPPKKVTGE